jgi:hypothetical protein
MDLERNKIVPPFKAPKDYFDVLEETILSKTKIDSLQKLEIKVEPDYFEKLENTILEKTIRASASTKPTFGIWKKNAFKYAASLFLVGSLATLTYLNLKSDPLADLSSDEISTYLETETLQGKDLQMALEEISADLPLSNTTTSLENIKAEDISAYLN